MGTDTEADDIDILNAAEKEEVDADRTDADIDDADAVEWTDGVRLGWVGGDVFRWGRLGKEDLAIGGASSG